MIVRKLLRLTLAQELPLMIVGAGSLVGVCVGAAAYFSAAVSLEREVEVRLGTLLESRKESLESYLESIKQDLHFVASNPTTRQALTEFSRAWNELEGDPTETLQRRYIQENPYPIGSKENLDAATDGSAYSRGHRAYHPWFRQFLRERGYYDVFLFDSDGNLIYSVFKERDYATNFISGPYRDTDLGHAFRAARDGPLDDFMSFFDFRPYAPSHGAPASFISTPVLADDREVIGVLVFQMPIDRLNAAVQDTSSLGWSGESFLVGADGLMRTDSRFSGGSTILTRKVESKAVARALAGEAGTEHLADLAGEPAIVAFTPVDFAGVRWAFLAEMDLYEARAPARALAWRIVGITAVALIVLSVLGWMLARGVVRSLNGIVGAVESMTNGEPFHVPGTDRDDEIGVIARAMDTVHQKGQEAVKAKSNFLANMSHEIRTPMNAIFGTAELMLDCELSPKVERYIRTIFHSSELLLALINDILDFSKAESSKISLEAAPFDLLGVVEDVAELLTPRAIEKMIDLSIRYVPDTPRFVIGDSVRVRQVLCNLIGNAIKFTEVGYVLITVENALDRQDTDDRLSLRVSIKDTGIGIPKDKQGLVFGRFAQADGSTTRQYGGTGLGLAISKKLVELMEGVITVESEVGDGSTFAFTMVLGLDTSSRHAEPDHFRLDGIKLLVVDDIEVNRSILSEQLKAAGGLCSAVECGDQTMLALREACRQGRPFDFAILDHMMPGENGIQLAERISVDPDLVDTTLIMLSSAMPYAGKNSSHRISTYLTKPARQQQLLDTLAALRTGEANGQPIIDRPKAFASGACTPARLAEASLQGLDVLLVEDNRVDRELAKETLSKLNCDVTVAENGKAAVALIMEKRFDIVLMDCQMPVMDGFEASRLISAMIAGDQIPSTPIIALTANAMKGDCERCLEAGMDDYVTKPIRKQTLIELLTRWCVTREAKGVLAAPRKASTAECVNGGGVFGPLRRSLSRPLRSCWEDTKGPRLAPLGVFAGSSVW